MYVLCLKHLIYVICSFFSSFADFFVQVMLYHLSPIHFSGLLFFYGNWEQFSILYSIAASSGVVLIINYTLQSNEQYVIDII